MCQDPRHRTVRRFGEKLRILRERHHLTTRHLGDKVGVSGAHISMLETGKSRPGVDLVIRIAQLFNVSADVLLDDALEVDT